jgi:ribonuclease HI
MKQLKLKPAISSRPLGDRLRAVTTTKDLCSCLKIPVDLWDAFIVTDGSATTIENTCGFASVLIERDEIAPKILAGSQSHGTNNAAELQAVITALYYLVEQKKGIKERGYRAYVLSDSSYVVQGLNRDILKWLPTMKSNKMLWMSILGAQRSGIVIQGHLIPRDTLDLNKVCHDVANVARKQQMRLMAGCMQIDLSDYGP